MPEVSVQLTVLCVHSSLQEGWNVIKDSLLTPREMAAASGWSERRIRALIAEGAIKHIRIGRGFFLPEDAVSDYVTRNMVIPASR